MSKTKKKSVKKATSKKVAKSSLKKTAKKPTVKATSKKKSTKKITKLKPKVSNATALKLSKAKKALTKKVKSKVVLKKAKVKKIAPKKVASKKTPKVKKVVKQLKPKVSKKVLTKKKEVKAPKSPKALKTPKPKIEVAKPLVAVGEKSVKVGVKTKKQLVPIAPQPIVEVADGVKSRVKTILLSQPRPEGDKHPFFDLAKKHNVALTFRQFIKIEGVPAKDFRAQRIDILDHKAVILNSKMAVDHYFRMCAEMRITVPESMKYFCTNEATAYYLQKYIQYRKRKIFFGHQSIQDLVDALKKNRDEKFLFPAADVNREQICDFLEALSVKYTKAIMYKTVSADLSDIKNLTDYDVIIFFTPAGVNALKQNFPNFKQGNTRIGCFGYTTANTIKKLGYRLDIYAPNPKYPSMFAALDDYIKQANKR